MPMRREIAEELLPRMRQRNTGRGREGRLLLIDELCEQWGYSLKHAINLRGAKSGWGGHQKKRASGRVGGSSPRNRRPFLKNRAFRTSARTPRSSS